MPKYFLMNINSATVILSRHTYC